MVWTARLRLTSAISLAFLLCACAERHASVGVDGQAGQAASGAAGRASSTTPAKLGARASATLDGLDPVAPDGELPLHGTAEFRVSDTGVDMTLRILGCKDGSKYRAYILEGGDCSSATLRGEHWDSPRGEGIGEMSCGTSGTVRAVLSRSNKDAKPWTIEGPAASNLLGHAIAVYDGDHASSCGVIGRDPDAPAEAGGKKPDAVPVEISAQIAGLCTARTIVRDNAQDCPNAKELDACSRAHCDLDPCVRACSDSGYIACLEKHADPCDGDISCDIDEKCADCRTQLLSCTLNFCGDQIACAAPVSPDGPCSQLLACCAMQGDMTAMCLDIVHTIAKWSGDPSCYGIQHDREFFAHLPVACKFE
ncbi:MAG TPA: hypothetical protein VJV78_05630 [Polyangiales bacterium]|nr:hypothetical protein [Polyangiales bacterium]